MTQIFLTHISTFCSLLPALPPALVYSRYSALPPTCHMLLHSTRPGNTRSLSNPSEGPSTCLLRIRSSGWCDKISIFPLLREERRTLLLFNPWFAAPLPVTARRSSQALALSPHPQFPEAEKLSHFFCLFLLFPGWGHKTQAQAVLVTSDWPQVSPLLCSLAQLLAESRRELWSAGVISSSVNSCRGKLSKDSVHHLAECPGQCRSQERGRAEELRSWGGPGTRCWAIHSQGSPAQPSYKILTNIGHEENLERSVRLPALLIWLL